MSTEQQDRGRHTPGPWEVRTNPGPGKVYEGGESPATVAAGDRLIATVGHQGREWEANARLVAAAPELLAACKVAEQVIEYLRARLRGDDVERLDVEYHAPKIGAAIAKAEGGAA